MRRRAAFFCIYLLVFGIAATIGLEVALLGRLIYHGLAIRHPTDMEGQFLAYGQTKFFGDYEHGALYWGLEPSVHDAIRKAKVVIVGSSHPQLGFSTKATRAYFADLGVSYYNLAMGYAEQEVFPAHLLSRIGAHPKVVIIDVDGIFQGFASAPALDVMDGRISTFNTYLLKAAFVRFQRYLCPWMESLCSQTYISIYRSVSDGASNIPENADGTWLPTTAAIPVVRNAKPELSPQTSDLAAQLVHARRFMDAVGLEKRCMIMTWVPEALGLGRDTHGAKLAHHLEVPFINPALEGLASYDSSHLNRVSAERWSAAALREMTPIIKSCIQADGHPMR